MTYTWWKQGLFSAAIHLVLTVISGVLAFGIWDMVVYYGVINALPENAWGIGLLIPFALILFIFRTLSDKLIPGELKISSMGNMIGGGACGFVSGVLVAGILVIGLQMTGLPKLLGYTGYGLTDDGQPAFGVTVGEIQSGPLLLPVDTLAAGFFTSLTDGAMAPISSARSFGKVHPRIDVAAAFFAQGEFGQSRKAIRKPNLVIVDMPKDEKDENAPGGKVYFRLDQAPENFGEQNPLASGEELVVVGAKVIMQSRDLEGAADADGIFRVKRPQVSLVYDDPSGKTDLVWPHAYIQGGEFVTIKSDYMYSSVGSSVTHYWVFKIPKDSSPYGIQIKHTLAELPETSNPGGVAAANALVTHVSKTEDIKFQVIGDAPPAEAANQPAISEEQSKEIAIVSENLPFPMGVNQLGKTSSVFDTDENVLISGIFSLKRDNKVSRKDGIISFKKAKTGRIVQVSLGSNVKTSLLGKVMYFATSSTSTPVLRDDKGEVHMPVGYTIKQGDTLKVKFDLSTTIRTLSQIPLAETSANDDVQLIYHVGAPRTIIAFELDPTKSQPLNLKVEERSY
jgi:hypothetical protein